MAARPNNSHPIRVAAPVAAGLLLLVLFGVGTLRPTVPVTYDAYLVDVVAEIDDIPYRIDRWNGRELNEAPPQAVEMLRPSRILHRGYKRDGTNEVVRLVVVHCPDVRDMAGHHPPNCYPATGWLQTQNARLDVEAFGSAQELALHSFRQPNDAGGRREITIASAFLVPGAPNRLVPDMPGLRGVSENRRQSLLGAAQIQMIFDGGTPADEIRDIAEKFLDALGPVAGTVTEGLE